MRRKWWWTLVIAGIGGLVAADHIVATYWDFPAASGELPQAVRDYRAAGLPWIAADIEVPVRPEENAAPLVRRAIGLMPNKSVESVFAKAYPTGSADPAPYAPALTILYEAVGKPKLDFERDWDLGANLSFPEPARLRLLTEALAVRAERHARAGDDASALADLTDARRLFVLVGQEPSVVAALVDVRIDGIVMSGAQSCLAAAHESAARLARYRAWLAAPTPLPDLRRALRGELYMIVANVRNFDRMGMGEGFLPTSDIEPLVQDCSECEEKLKASSVPRREGLPENTRSRAYMARCLQMWTELARETNGLRDPIDRLVDREEAAWNHHENDRGLSHQFDSILFPVFANLGKSNRRSLALRAVALAFADALTEHARTGRWPTALTTPDPLGNGPLRVGLDKGRFRAWSVGWNGKDEGGLTDLEARAMGKASDDIVAAYPPLPAKPRP